MNNKKTTDNYISRYYFAACKNGNLGIAAYSNIKENML